MWLQRKINVHTIRSIFFSLSVFYIFCIQNTFALVLIFMPRASGINLLNYSGNRDERNIKLTRNIGSRSKNEITSGKKKKLIVERKVNRFVCERKRGLKSKYIYFQFKYMIMKIKHQKQQQHSGSNRERMRYRIAAIIVIIDDARSRRPIF